MKNKLIKIGTLLSVSIPAIAVSCSLDKTYDIKADGKLNISSSNKTDYIQAKVNEDDFATTHGGFGGNYIHLSNAKYNQIYNQTNINEVAIVIIADHKIYKDFVQTTNHTKLIDLLQSSRYEFKTTKHPMMGEWLDTFKIDGTTNWLHGTATGQQRWNYFPYLYWNHTFSQLGASNFSPEGKDIIEITYDY